MAHELEFVNGVAQMAFVGETPWHGLGAQVADDLAPAEMMKAAGVDWRVQEVDTFAEFNGNKVPTGMKALIRETDGRVLTQVGKGWHPVQNEEAFEFFKDFTDAGKMKMHTAGSLKNGEIIWALAKVDDSFELFNGDKVDSYMLFSNPHQYGKTIDIRFTPIRVVCNNTLTLSLNQSAANAVKLNHRRQFDAEAVKDMMGIAHFKMAEYKNMASFLGSKRTTEDTLKEYFGSLLGMSNKKYLPLKHAPVTIEVEIVNTATEVLLEAGDSYSGTAISDSNTSFNWQLEDCQIKCDTVLLDSGLNENYTKHLLEGKALPLEFETYVAQENSIVGNNVSVQISRAVSKLNRMFLTFYKPTADSGEMCRTQVPKEVPLIRASEIRTISVTPASIKFFGTGIIPHSGIPGTPTGPQSRNTKTESFVIFKVGSSIRLRISAYP
jgi:phage/plasmid-like protein (TIGR03299 family)